MVLDNNVTLPAENVDQVTTTQPPTNQNVKEGSKDVVALTGTSNESSKERTKEILALTSISDSDDDEEELLEEEANKDDNPGIASRLAAKASNHSYEAQGALPGEMFVAQPLSEEQHENSITEERPNPEVTLPELARQQPIEAPPGAFHIAGPVTISGEDQDRHLALSDEVQSDQPIGEEQSDPADLICAVMVEDPEDMEAQVREKIMREAVQAEVVSMKRKRFGVFLLLAILVVIACTIIAVTFTLVPKDDDAEASNGLKSPAEPVIWRPTMKEVLDRGYVKCGVIERASGFCAPSNITGELEGMNIEHCRAVALAVFDDPSRYETIIVSILERFTALSMNRVDFLATPTTHTMGRDVYEATLKSGLTFSVPFMYTGLAFAGIPEFVSCADNLDTINGSCRLLRICVALGSTHQLILNQMLRFASLTVEIASEDDYVAFFNEGKCNVIAKDAASLPETRIRQDGYLGPYAMGRKVFSREPLTLVTRSDNQDWSDLVNSVVQLLYNAEAMNLTQEKAVEVMDSGSSNYLETESKALMVRLVAKLGNYGEIYSRTFEHIFPRSGLNLIHGIGDGDKGLLYYFPFGDLQAQGADLTVGGTLERILERGYLVCGISSQGFAAELLNESRSWHEFNVELCKALNAAIHLGEIETVEFVDVSNATERYALLASGAIDVVAGERVTLQNDIKEATTGFGYTFSTPYFYSNTGDAHAFVTSQADNQWSDFVNWIVMAIVYAEEESISSQANLTNMPAVKLFGDKFVQMFLDCVAAVGNYGEIYQRTLEHILPRSGGNLLNHDLSGPQQFPVPFN